MNQTIKKISVMSTISIKQEILNVSNMFNSDLLVNNSIEAKLQLIQLCFKELQKRNIKY